MSTSALADFYADFDAATELAPASSSKRPEDVFPLTPFEEQLNEKTNKVTRIYNHLELTAIVKKAALPGTLTSKGKEHHAPYLMIELTDANNPEAKALFHVYASTLKAEGIAEKKEFKPTATQSSFVPDKSMKDITGTQFLDAMCEYMFIKSEKTYTFTNEEGVKTEIKSFAGLKRIALSSKIDSEEAVTLKAAVKEIGTLATQHIIQTINTTLETQEDVPLLDRGFTFKGRVTQKEGSEYKNFTLSF